MTWQDAGTPGFSGSKKQEILEGYNKEYGKDNWRIVWRWNEWIDGTVDQAMAYQIYEDAYYMDSFNRDTLWQKLAATAKDVYDHTPTNVNSGLDYNIQEGDSTHLQDISIRRVMKRRGWKFTGDELVQIRSHTNYWGNELSPGRVIFHEPLQIAEPRLNGWWDVDTIEDFYQSNKLLQIKK